MRILIAVLITILLMSSGVCFTFMLSALNFLDSGEGFGTFLLWAFAFATLYVLGLFSLGDVDLKNEQIYLSPRNIIVSIIISFMGAFISALWGITTL
ncbi:hypothetical protein [uncultured Helicobacter sp.]|uniref:hypothetical protein n=1 Tax=uncultured Helicobacter sp. TaxID=175537 RepID=UPI003753E32D